MQHVQTFIGHYNYFITIFLMVAGLYIVIARGNMIKKLVGPRAVPDLGLSALHRAGQDHRRHGADPGPGLQGLLQPAAARADPDGDRGRRGDAGARPGHRRAHSRSLRHHRGGRDFRSGSAGMMRLDVIQHLPGSAGRHSTSRCRTDGFPAPRHRGMGPCRHRHLADARHRRRIALASAAGRADLLSPRRLAAAVGHRVPRRSPERVRAGARFGGQRRDDAVRAPQRGVRRSRATSRPGSTPCTCFA